MYRHHLDAAIKDVYGAEVGSKIKVDAKSGTIFVPKGPSAKDLLIKIKKYDQHAKLISTKEDKDYIALSDPILDQLGAKLEAKQRLKSPLIKAAPIDTSNLKKGAFHHWLGKAEDEPITEADIKKGLESKDPHVRRMAQFAENAKDWKH